MKGSQPNMIHTFHGERIAVGDQVTLTATIEEFGATVGADMLVELRTGPVASDCIRLSISAHAITTVVKRALREGDRVVYIGDKLLPPGEPAKGTVISIWQPNRQPPVYAWVRWDGQPGLLGPATASISKLRLLSED